MNKMMIILIRVYQISISPFLGTRCRFHPSCSSYAVESFEKKNFFAGFFCSVTRLIKCNPFHSGGHDPVELSK